MKKAEEGWLLSLANNADKRAALNGWAPGNYLNRCWRCEYEFIGDKRAVICAPCAYKDKKQ